MVCTEKGYLLSCLVLCILRAPFNLPLLRSTNGVPTLSESRPPRGQQSPEPAKSWANPITDQLDFFPQLYHRPGTPWREVSSTCSVAAADRSVVWAWKMQARQGPLQPSRHAHGRTGRVETQTRRFYLLRTTNSIWTSSNRCSARNTPYLATVCSVWLAESKIRIRGEGQVFTFPAQSRLALCPLERPPSTSILDVCRGLKSEREMTSTRKSCSSSLDDVLISYPVQALTGYGHGKHQVAQPQALSSLL